MKIRRNGTRPSERCVEDRAVMLESFRSRFGRCFGRASNTIIARRGVPWMLNLITWPKGKQQ
ncbi:hypothetical protein [Deinococcus yavapaiensis]|uniref:Uncharacterized protein n=1 Tax=Deinococcus yavapaiensis KR-236 TaxID=694435 RepID=A0A318S252_9DEIO|nr:hypothetical protein [Deinococcus yavapaiensis]PYE49449.1 hypothetical protein DES52_12343 [Deinococcus yavapaiensis KR-236]